MKEAGCQKLLFDVKLYLGHTVVEGAPIYFKHSSFIGKPPFGRHTTHKSLWEIQRSEREITPVQVAFNPPKTDKSVS